MRQASIFAAVVLIAAGMMAVSSGANSGSRRLTVWTKQDYAPPLSFEPNQGQADPAVKFMARSAGCSLFLTPIKVVIAFGHSAAGNPPPEGKHSFAITLIGGNSESRAVAQHELPGRSSYFAGVNPQAWRKGIPTFESVQFNEVYQGINVSYRGPQGRLEYEFSVSPNSQPGQIRVEIPGASDLRIQRDGYLVLRTGERELQFHPAVAYQETATGKQLVRARYRLLGNRQIGFALGEYDRSKRLIIGPVLRNTRTIDISGE